MLPGVLLAAAGAAFAGLAVLPASAAELAPRVSAADVLGPVVLAAPATANVELMSALQRGAAAAVLTPAAAPAPVSDPAAAPAPAAPAPAAPPAAVDRPAERASRDRGPVVEAVEAVTVNGAKFVRPGTGRLTSPYGRRWGRLHGGIDLAAGMGAPIRAVTDATVTTATTESGYGRVIRLLHSDGTVSVYAHLSTIAVSVGDKVGAGEQIGKEGSTGHSTGPHLHFEIRINDVPINPAPWLRARGIVV